MKKIIIGVLIGLFAATVVIYCSFVRPNVRSALNRNRIAIIQCAIGDSIVLGKKSDEELLLYMKKTFPNVAVTSNAILDYYRNPVRYVVTEGSNSIFVGVYSAGSDGIWKTVDDVEREGSLLKDANADD